jgi:hypothetical protein
MKIRNLSDFGFPFKSFSFQFPNLPDLIERKIGKMFLEAMNLTSLIIRNAFSSNPSFVKKEEKVSAILENQKHNKIAAGINHCIFYSCGVVIPIVASIMKILVDLK